MVYGGKPSTGCQTCRQRHIKCDETRPHCRACTRTGRACPGYPHPLDVMLRDRIAFQRKKRDVYTSKHSVSATKDKADSEDPSPPPTNPDTAILLINSTSGSPSSSLVYATPPSQLPGSLSLPVEDTVASLFFNSYLFLPKDPLIRLGYMELLPKSYFDAPSDSHLRLAVLAVAYFSVAAWTGQRSLLGSAEQAFMKTVSKTRLALQGDTEQGLDELLMTILLLSTFEEFNALKENRVTNKAHLQGAIALVNSKRLGQRESPNSQTLTMAVQAQVNLSGVVLPDGPNAEDMAASNPSNADRIGSFNNSHSGARESETGMGPRVIEIR
ncbi:hypothetical protein EYZ11_010016 [Aspergillus tanneri]|uniref:Zn(2)-C6 fungal-type domain-containing protein n=1 Tax=Aspergillus tanneri TaxID=1220188 RepID=A0A4S3J6X9_9EURO|nr:hypothetical protein EYZ11_010016 [Aspergillus tanneri]